MRGRTVWQSLLEWAVALAIGMTAACGSTEPQAVARGRFTLTVAGAVDTSVTGGPAMWTDLSNAGADPVEHRLVLWADGGRTVPSVQVALSRGTTAPSLEAGATYTRGAGALLLASFATSCPPLTVGDVCGPALVARDGAPVELALARVEADSIAGRLEFEASGWLTGGPTGSGAPPDSVTVVLDFVVPRQGEFRRR